MIRRWHIRQLPDEESTYVHGSKTEQAITISRLSVFSFRYAY